VLERLLRALCWSVTALVFRNQALKCFDRVEAVDNLLLHYRTLVFELFNLFFEGANSFF